MRILLIEDDPDIFSLLQTVFQKWDWKLVWAETAQEGIQLFDEETPDLVISDLGLPDVDGTFLAQVFKQRSSETPLIYLTARNNQNDQAAALASGAAAYITKPFEADTLLQEMRRILKLN